MIIIKFMGGLGNQMFQYALYKKLETMGREVYADLTFYEGQEKIVYELDAFPIKVAKATDAAINRFTGNGKDFFSIAKRKMGLRSKKYYCEDTEVHFQPEILRMDNIYLDGYWQSEKYFVDIKNILLKKFLFPCPSTRNTSEMEAEIKKCESVSVHVRRGDYLAGRAKELYGGICSVDYYKNAIAYIKRKRKNPRFFFFSDDMDWVVNELKIKEGVYVNPKETGSHMDMYLMTQCKDNIIANSSFSWWGAWLNQNERKLVVSPPNWFNLHEAPDVICDDWVKMG